jgi:DNA-binding beta-propeller fold protein YncE
VLPITVGSGSPPSDTLGAPVPMAILNYWPLNLPSSPADVIVPTAINVLASGSDLFITAYDASVTPSAGYIFAFAVGSGGALTPLNGGVPFPAGIHPSGIASDSTSSYLYVTDIASGNVLGYSVASGLLTAISGSPFPAGNQPSAVVADSDYPYLYVANSLDSTVMAYSIGSGALTALGTYATGTSPSPSASIRRPIISCIPPTISETAQQARSPALS